ncbi:MAG: hypothetical protein WC708_16680 [Lentisphaeria bacterium]
MRGLFLSVCAAGGLVVELWAGSGNWLLPAWSVTAFYATVVHDWRLSFFPWAIAGLILDVAYGRAFPVTAVLLLPLAVLLARFWRREGYCRSIPTQAIPGAVLGLALCMPALWWEGCRPENQLGWRLMLHMGFLGLQWMVGSALLLPAVCWGLDKLAARLSLPRYQSIQQRRIEPHA